MSGTSCACGASISPKTKSGRCARCAAADPAVRARKGKMTPEQRERHSARAREMNADPAIVAKRNATNALNLTDPAYRQRHADACRRSKAERVKDPAFREMLAENGRRYGDNRQRARAERERAQAY